jgi:hypothetical protein
MIQALKSGILILIAPPTFMSIGLIFVCYRKRNQTRDKTMATNPIANGKTKTQRFGGSVTVSSTGAYPERQRHKRCSAWQSGASAPLNPPNEVALAL